MHVCNKRHDISRTHSFHKLSANFLIDELDSPKNKETLNAC